MLNPNELIYENNRNEIRCTDFKPIGLPHTGNT